MAESPTRWLEIVVLGGNAKDVFDFALAWAEARGLTVTGNDPVVRIVIGVKETPTAVPWWVDKPLPFPVKSAKALLTYPDNQILLYNSSTNTTKLWAVTWGMNVTGRRVGDYDLQVSTNLWVKHEDVELVV